MVQVAQDIAEHEVLALTEHTFVCIHVHYVCVCGGGMMTGKVSNTHTHNRKIHMHIHTAHPCTQYQQSDEYYGHQCEKL